MNRLDSNIKQSLRLVAAGALLHNLGKINAKFLDRQINDANNNYLYQHILGLIAPHVSQLPPSWQSDYDVNRLSFSAVLERDTVTALKTVLSLPVPFNDRIDYMIGDLIEYLGQGELWYSERNGQYGIEYIFSSGSRLTHLMNRAHRGASGGEKQDIATAQQSDVTDLYLSTPFGYETVAPNIDNIDDLLHDVEVLIQQYLKTPVDPFPLSDFIADIWKPFSQSIADTQRPLNDVTVGDIGHTGMAFLLTQATEWILNRRIINHIELAREEDSNTLLWRVLTIHTNSLRYFEEATSLADLRVRQEQLQFTFHEVSQELEKTLLAVEIYADEQRRLFVVPDASNGDSIYKLFKDIVASFSVDGLSLTSQLSEPVTNHPKDNGGSYIGDEVLEQLKNIPPYDFEPHSVVTFWSECGMKERTQICTACNLRPQGYGVDQIDAYKNNPIYYQKKAKGRNICCICMSHRSGVAEDWVTSRLDTTVWLDEVADNNGRLALVIGQFNISNFANNLSYPKNVTKLFLDIELSSGSLLPGETVEIQGHTFIWSSTQERFVGPREAEIPSSFKRTDLYIRPLNQSVNFLQISYRPDGNFEVTLDNAILTIGDTYQVSNGNFIARSQNMIITQDKEARNLISERFWSSTNGVKFIVRNGRRQEIIADSTQNYSFARLRRIWQVTRQFWQYICATDPGNSCKDSLVGRIFKQYPARLKIKGMLNPLSKGVKLGHYHAYVLKLTAQIKLSVVWDPQIELFITCDNLDYLAKPELLGNPVQDYLKGELDLEEPAGYGSQNKRWGTITIEKVEPLRDSHYVPAIPILAEPRTFMALVPADKALDILQAIKTKYEREMGKVRNRLPLHMGVVYFQRRTPLRTALDAGQRMLEQRPLGGDEPWTVVADVIPAPLPNDKQRLAQGTQQFNETLSVSLSQGSRSFTWYVPAKMGDGSTEDKWYPYVFFASDKEGQSDPQHCSKPRDLVFKGLRPTNDDQTEVCWLIHASQLKPGDRIYFTPATFDFEWLDTTARRFAIAYDKQGQRIGRLTRPYLLDQLDDMESAWQTLQKLSKNQLYALRDTIEEKRQAWFATPQDSLGDPTFEQFCADVVRNTKWQENVDVEQLGIWAVNGLLTDVIELHASIMKEDSQTEEQSNE